MDKCRSITGCTGTRHPTTLNVHVELCNIVVSYEVMQCDICGDITALEHQRKRNSDAFDVAYRRPITPMSSL